MDAATVGDRSKNIPKVVLLENKETLFDSAYPLEDHWMGQLPQSGYKLVGEYEIDKTTLYRWELQDLNKLEWKNPKYYNILISKKK